MRKLPWIIYAGDDDEIRAKFLARAKLASVDLHELAERIAADGKHLVLHESVDTAFEFTDELLPPDTVDARELDALGIALADETAVIVTVSGRMIPHAIEADPRWELLVGLGRPRALLSVNALSGHYYGLTVHGEGAPSDES